ncbi:MAG: cadherin-like domain-containing protein [Kangiellaceae bacterium]|nr:cadherin-like domain-containing protein [Kangiellaceae bacterium]
MQFLLKGSLALASIFLFTAGSYANQKEHLQGTITINYEDHIGQKGFSAEHHGNLTYQLTDQKGQSYEVLLDKQPQWLQTGQTVRLQAQRHNQKLTTSSNDLSLLQGGTESTSNVQALQSQEVISGNHKVLVTEVNFAINPIVRFSSSQLSDMLFNQAHQFFLENSYGAFGLVGDALEPVTVDVDTSVCNTSIIADQADSILRQRGYEPNNYDHVMYVMPTHPKCTWSGKGNVNGPRSWIKRFELSTVNHELGHNLGLYHSNKKECGSVTTNSEHCSIVEYGDYNSAMSSTTSSKHFNGFHKEQLGWLPQQMIKITDNQTITLSPLETQDNNLKIAKILKGTNSQGQLEYYYIEYRQAIGFDASLASEFPQFLTGVRLREAIADSANSSNLLDPTPNSNSYDWDDISLDPGAIYQDAEYGVTITILSSDANSLSLNVAYDQSGGSQPDPQPEPEPTTNTAPVANNDLVIISNKNATNIDVLINDYDAEFDSITISEVSQGSKGSVQINHDGSLTYTPSKRFKTTDSFTYIISDGTLTNSATVTINLHSSSDGETDEGGSTGGKGGAKGRK